MRGNERKDEYDGAGKGYDEVKRATRGRNCGEEGEMRGGNYVGNVEDCEWRWSGCRR